jgi:flagellar motor switch protein FliN/FliY
MSGNIKGVETGHESQAAQEIKLQELKQGALGNNLYNGNLGLIQNLKVKLEVFVGGCEISVGELFALKENSILNLDRATNESLDIYLDGKPVARGNLVVVDDNFGICITEISHAKKP